MNYHATLNYMRIRDRDLYRDFELRVDGDVVAEYTTKNKVFEGINWRSSTPNDGRDQFPAELLEELALG